MEKRIIGLIGTKDSGRTTAAKVLQKKGFYIVSINDKVAELASHLFSKEELQREGNVILNNVRKRGTKVNKDYWLNLILVSVPDNAKYIVFDDISLDEAENSKISAYQIYRPNVSAEKLDDIDTVENDGNLKDFTSKINNLYDRFTSGS